MIVLVPGSISSEFTVLAVVRIRRPSRPRINTGSLLRLSWYTSVSSMISSCRISSMMSSRVTTPRNLRCSAGLNASSYTIAMWDRPSWKIFKRSSSIASFEQTIKPCATRAFPLFFFWLTIARAGILSSGLTRRSCFVKSRALMFPLCLSKSGTRECPFRRIIASVDSSSFVSRSSMKTSSAFVMTFVAGVTDKSSAPLRIEVSSLVRVPCSSSWCAASKNFSWCRS
mmetsp:Transcript_20104/g.49855  ORF Transcript_20104/g.49855 Transcript_20104/m.49855 type:complete len:227 (+) Transcript_20104:954-1634(+)